MGVKNERQRITKAALVEFIDAVEADWDSTSVIPPAWQDLRAFVGLEYLTHRTLLEKSIRRLERLLKHEDALSDSGLAMRRNLIELQSDLLDLDEKEARSE